MPVPVLQLLRTAVRQLLLSAHIVWGEKKANNSTLICLFDMYIFLLMLEVHHKNNSWINSYS